MAELTIPAELSQIAVVSAFMEETTEAMGLSLKGQTQLNVVLDELLANIISYAYPDGTGTATVRIDEDAGHVRMTFIDTGVPYDPTQKDDPDVTASADDRQVGGLGIFMAKKLTDRMEYHYHDGCNILTVWKKI